MNAVLPIQLFDETNIGADLGGIYPQQFRFFYCFSGE